MDAAELLARSERFALSALNFYRRLSKGLEAQVPGGQFYRASTSAWMNYRSAKRGRSRAEFVSKMGTVVEESDEAVGWLEFMEKGLIASDDTLIREARELCAIFTASFHTARANLETARAEKRQRKTQVSKLRIPD
jgi:four helix bundle protein